VSTSGFTAFQMFAPDERVKYGQIRWWALGTFAKECARIIETARLERNPAPVNGLVPELLVSSVEDLPLVAAHCKILLEIITGEVHHLAALIAEAPALFQPLAADDTFRQLGIVVEGFGRFARRARQIEQAFIESVRYEKRSQSTPFGNRVELIVSRANLELRAMARHYVGYTESIPVALGRLRELRAAGNLTEGVSLLFSPRFDPDDSLPRLVNLLNEEIDLAIEIIASGGTRTSAKAGKVYAMMNPSMPGLVKIGRTGASAEERAAQLSTTGVPTPFIVLHEVEVDDSEAGERKVHQSLKSHRVSDRREFFAIEPKHAVAALNALAAEQVER
jgi:hypothetical protein